jgi:large subunit ribosomal protein L24
VGLSIRKNDTVIVISGDEAGKRGRVLAVYPKKERLLVEKLNIIKRHMKPSRKYTQGGIIEKEAPVHRSNVMLICPKCDKPTKIGQKILVGDSTLREGGAKVRVCKKCGEVLE